MDAANGVAKLSVHTKGKKTCIFNFEIANGNAQFTWIHMKFMG